MPSPERVQLKSDLELFQHPTDSEVCEKHDRYAHSMADKLEDNFPRAETLF